MKILIKLYSLGLFLFAHQNTNAQQIFVSQERGNDSVVVGILNRTVSQTDLYGNLVVVSSRVMSNRTSDVHVVKYHKDGSLLWNRTFNGSGNGNDFSDPRFLILNTDGSIQRLVE